MHDSFGALLQGNLLGQCFQNLLFEVLRLLLKVFENFHEDALLRKLVFGGVNVEMGHFGRLGLGSGLCLFGRHHYLIHVVVVEQHVRIFEVDEGVTLVRLQTAVAVGVLALVARKNNFLLLVVLHLAVRFRLKHFS